MVVLRLVYDGPAEAGKTTTLKALGKSLERDCTSPGTSGERTRFFDWVGYRGGSYEGRQIDCQIVSVPGQEELRHRREVLIQSADVLIYVAPSAQQSIEETVLALSKLKAECEPDVRIVCQVNQRDLPGAYSVDELRTRLHSVVPEIETVETVARVGQGVRQAFIFAVRHALERVSELTQSGQLVEGVPVIAQPGELFAQMTALESTSPSGPPETGTNAKSQPPPSHRVVLQGGARPHPIRLPGCDAENGSVWPPVAGRRTLIAATAVPAEVAPVGEGCWKSSEGWCFFSSMNSVFDSCEEGQAQLLRLAQQQTAQSGFHSEARCLVLQPEADGTYRLWEVWRAADDG